MLNYRKAAAAVLATILSGVVAALTDGTVTPIEWLQVVILGAGAAGVFAAPNVPGARYTKSALAVLTAVVTLAVQLLTATGWPLPTSAWLQLAIAALGALGVYAAPNRRDLDPKVIDAEVI